MSGPLRRNGTLRRRSERNRPAADGFFVTMSRWPATAVVASAIIALSELPPTAFPETPLFPHIDKAVHLVEYLALGALLFRSVLHEFSGNFRAAAIITVVAGTVFGALDEWHQAFAGRSPDGWDVVADVIGLAGGVACIALAKEWRRKHGE